ncbi:hypothetical protein PLICRDRAFT_695459, partial [Plicaturopsis crispa FD-325 SS-3]
VRQKIDKKRTARCWGGGSSGGPSWSAAVRRCRRREVLGTASSRCSWSLAVAGRRRRRWDCAWTRSCRPRGWLRWQTPSRVSSGGGTAAGSRRAAAHRRPQPAAVAPWTSGAVVARRRWAWCWPALARCGY